MARAAILATTWPLQACANSPANRKMGNPAGTMPSHVEILRPDCKETVLHSTQSCIYVLHPVQS